MNRGKIRLLNGKTTDLHWHYSRNNQKKRILICDLLFMPFVKSPRQLILKLAPVDDSVNLLEWNKHLLITIKVIAKVKEFVVSGTECI